MNLRTRTRCVRSIGIALSIGLVSSPAAKPQNTTEVPSWSLRDRMGPFQDGHAEAELRAGIELARQGHFMEAISHLRAAQGHVAEQYAAEFNLSLCYVGAGQFPAAIQMLNSLRIDGHDNVNIENLLAQAYIGNEQGDESFDALQRAAKLEPKNEKLYVFVSDACADHQEYELGMRVVELGLSHIPDSARLHYQRGYFLSVLDQFDTAKTDFDFVVNLAPHTEISYVASAQKALFAGNLPGAITAARAAVREGLENYLTLTLLGEALIRSGSTPGQPEFAEAAAALKKAVLLRPRYASSQIALGYLLFMDNQVDEAIEHLEIGRRLDRRNTAVYSHLAAAYRKTGRRSEADQILVMLAKLNEEQAAHINSALGDYKPIPGRTANRPQP
jgi:tetratricopeptide (TPR) repeat protein